MPKLCLTLTSEYFSTNGKKRIFYSLRVNQKQKLGPYQMRVTLSFCKEMTGKNAFLQH